MPVLMAESETSDIFVSAAAGHVTNDDYSTACTYGVEIFLHSCEVLGVRAAFGLDKPHALGNGARFGQLMTSRTSEAATIVGKVWLAAGDGLGTPLWNCPRVGRSPRSDGIDRES